MISSRCKIIGRLTLLSIAITTRQTSIAQSSTLNPLHLSVTL